MTRPPRTYVKMIYSHPPKVPKRVKPMVDKFYADQKENLGYTKYKVSYDPHLEEFQIDAFTKPSYYPSEYVTSIITVRPKTQKLICTCRVGLDDRELVEWMAENCGKAE